MAVASASGGVLSHGSSNDTTTVQSRQEMDRLELLQKSAAAPSRRLFAMGLLKLPMGTKHDIIGSVHNGHRFLF